MVTCKVDTVTVPKMNSVRARKVSSSNSSGFRLLDADHLETASSISKNSVYKLKIDLMFDDTRSGPSNRLDDNRGSQRTRSIIMYGRSELTSSAGGSSKSMANKIQESYTSSKTRPNPTKKDVQRLSNTVQAQIEQMFTDVAKDATSSFSVNYLGCLSLKDKVTSLQGLQDPLRKLYIQYLTNDNQNLGTGFLDICANGLRVKIISDPNNKTSASSDTDNDGTLTPFHHIAVWSAVKFVVSEEERGAAFLPLITDPENIDKSSLFHALSSVEELYATRRSHAPIFAVVMRSSLVPKLLECHGFICKSTEDAIVIAATLYQSLMTHVNFNSYRSTKRRAPRNQNGVSCVSIASSSAMTGSNYLSRSQVVSNGHKSSFRSLNGNHTNDVTQLRSGRKKRMSNSSLSSSSNIINETLETTTEERKRKSHKTKRAPPVPLMPTEIGISTVGHKGSHRKAITNSIVGGDRNDYHDNIYRVSETVGSNVPPTISEGPVSPPTGGVLRSIDTSGDILTRVAIPRSGSFLNTGGLTRYKSRAARRHSGKLGGGCGGGSPLGFSELFNEFRLHENLHSLDDILYAIIDADGMSFNDLKPIYKEFLLKLAVTLTKDELFQRSKNIMRRQKKKKKLKRKSNPTVPQKKPKSLIFGKKNFKKVFQLGQFRSCRGKPPKAVHNKESNSKYKSEKPITTGQPLPDMAPQQRSRIATSGSDVSIARNEHGLHCLNRNSSSGYVSCSECSYDSEACTCAPADRCYCSLRTDQVNKGIRYRNDHSNAHSKNVRNQKTKKLNSYSLENVENRNSLISCKSDDKCYCSMVEKNLNKSSIEDDTNNTNSDTTWCDTDSCISASKCYCKHKSHRKCHIDAESCDQYSQRLKSRTKNAKTNEKLAFDYELFSINGNGKSVQPHEALSVKKSVEAAAVFADVKFTQTTDIKSLCQRSGSLSIRKTAECKDDISFRSQSSTQKRSNFNRNNSNSCCVDERNDFNATNTLFGSASLKSCSADDLLCKLSSIEKAVESTESIKSMSSHSRKLLRHPPSPIFKNNYQHVRATSGSLEDTLGYLP